MKFQSFFVKPAVPTSLKPLYDLAYNTWSTWDNSANTLFSRIDPSLFREVHHNPVEFLYRLGADRLAGLAKDPGFLFELEQVWYKFVSYQSFEGTYSHEGQEIPFGPRSTIAYLCMEFSLHESLPIYSGGLGILAGDYLKAASDIGLPLLGFGLLYRYGYFSQRINQDAFQEEEYRENIWFFKPITEVLDKDGQPLIIEVPIQKTKAAVKVWQIGVGRTKLYLLDTNLPQNEPRVRAITDMLYDSNRDDRIEQELILGRGSRIAMRALGIEPSVYHLNEGHSAFLILERLKQLMLEDKLPFGEAANLIRNTTVFTTHTPVIEGNEHFDKSLVSRYIKADLEQIGINATDFFAMGAVQPNEPVFWLPALAMRFSRFCNGVSKIHAEVSRKMWQPLFPKHHFDEIPIDSITNGVHVPTWLSIHLEYLFDRYIGPDYQHHCEAADVWDKIDGIPDSEIWEAHRRSKNELISFLRRRLHRELERKGFSASKLSEVEDILTADALTIGFARRMAPYKRADLILQDPERLKKILTNKTKPVQLILSGKSHPADVAGKQILKNIIDFIQDNKLQHRMVFVEDYDMDVARHLVQGVDVWLNNPLKPLEASGTSGMKAGINGVLNLSVLDGWWPEAFDGQNGWAVTAGESHSNPEVKRVVEANQIYELLEDEIVPLYFERSESGIPFEWIRRMKHAMVTVGNGFNMHRMLREYLYKFYLPEMETSAELFADDLALLKEISAMQTEVDKWWPKVYIKDVFPSFLDQPTTVGQEVSLDCYVYLDNAPDSLFGVEAVHLSGRNIDQLGTSALSFVEKYPDNVAKFSGSFVLHRPGQHKLGVRIRPNNPLFRETYPEYIKWAE